MPKNWKIDPIPYLANNCWSGMPPRYLCHCDPQSYSPGLISAGDEEMPFPDSSSSFSEFYSIDLLTNIFWLLFYGPAEKTDWKAVWPEWRLFFYLQRQLHVEKMRQSGHAAHGWRRGTSPYVRAYMAPPPKSVTSVPPPKNEDVILVSQRWFRLMMMALFEKRGQHTKWKRGGGGERNK